MIGNVLIAAPVHDILIDGLTGAGYNCLLHSNITQQGAPELIANCVGVITSTRLQLDKALLDAAVNLKWIGRMGSGMEVIDVPYATKKGIYCYSSPEGNSNAVAEHALGMLLSLNKNIGLSANEVMSGIWRREENRGVELEGKTIGIIGFGHTGRSFAKKLQGFEVEILAYDKYDRGDIPSYVSCCDTLTEIQKNADIISFHVPLQEDTQAYFNDKFASAIANPFILINTSRGNVVCSEALLAGLNSGKVAGACLDVWEQEPLEEADERSKQMLIDIAKMQNVIVTPHIAGYSYEALYKMSKVLLNKIVMNR